jgi:hypothetical protein
MWASLFTDFDLPYWAIVPVIGLASAGLALIVGRAMFARRSAAKSQPMGKATQPAFGQSDPFIHGAAGELRTGFRRSGNPVEVRVADAEATKDLTRGWVIDRSVGGMCLALFEPIDTGTIISIRPSRGADLAPWVQVEVMSCRRATDSWEAGCRFVRTPPWSVLLLFG